MSNYPIEYARSYETALLDLGVLLHGAERDFVARILRILVHKRHEFITVILDGGAANGADEPEVGWASFQCTERMNALLAAARERDSDRLAIIEHDVFSLSPVT